MTFHLQKGSKVRQQIMSSSDASDFDQASGVSLSDHANNTPDRPVEQVYQKKTQLEHILLRPDTYIGSVEKATQEMWIVDHNGKMLKRMISYVPGLYKIFDEILVNAADNAQRDKNMKEIRVEINVKDNKVTVRNDGKGIPIEKHKIEKVWVPELIFGHLLTSSNFDDSKKKTTGGRNGYGAKLCNVFSSKFIVETVDSKKGKKYVQTFTKNMSVKNEPIITSFSGKDYTQITFYPDLVKFNMQLLDDDIVGLMTKRAYDLAGTVKGINVYLNKSKIPVKGFKEYVQLYSEAIQKENESENVPNILFDIHPNWEIAIVPSNGQFQHSSFVNNINTFKGGPHVNKCADKFAEHICEFIKKKHKNLKNLKNFQIRNQMFLFVNCLIQNPSFDSQTKEHLTTIQSKFGTKYEPSDAFLKKLLSSGIVEQVVDLMKVKLNKDLKKGDGSKRSVITGIPKLDDANNAGTRLAKNCVLILTEGDSAKSLAVCGLSVVGRDNYGCFPLRGKVLNVRDANPTQVSNNAEIQNLKKILGLQHNKKYETVDSLRYGSIMIMADQDSDGSHIKGLIINLLETYWPSLLEINGFLTEFVTPIIKCTNNRTKESICFFTIPEYDSWKIENPTGWTNKYYKGLGTSTAQDGKFYFSNLETHLKPFLPMTLEDREAIQLAFSKKKADLRKEWLSNFVPGTYLDHSRKHLAIKEFINKELILFSMADNIRSIPSVVDGLKPGQRKVLFACFKRKLVNEIKVAQLSGYVAEHSAYHHGEQSLNMTIVNLAQDYVGSNNINLLQPIGQFGTRLTGGKDAASARYIFTQLSNITRHIYNPNDDGLLNYLNDDGLDIEPSYYVPILPMVLINGSSGIGTGWSSTIPNYNPIDIVSNLKMMLNGLEPNTMHPFYRNFNGAIEILGSGKYKLTGLYTLTDNQLTVNELPIGMWTQTFKELLESYMVRDEKTKRDIYIHDYKEYHTDEVVHFIINLTDLGVRNCPNNEEIEKKFRLSTTIATTNLVCFDVNGKICKYATVNDILKEFYKLRLNFYNKRKVYMIDQMTKDLELSSEKARFIMMILDETLVIKNKATRVLYDELGLLGFKHIEQLMQMPISSLTMERIALLQKDKMTKEAELLKLKNTSIQEVWESDLDGFVEELKVKEQLMLEALQGDGRRGKKNKKKLKNAVPTNTPVVSSFFKESNIKENKQTTLSFKPLPKMDIKDRVALMLKKKELERKFKINLGTSPNKEKIEEVKEVVVKKKRKATDEEEPKKKKKTAPKKEKKVDIVISSDLEFESAESSIVELVGEVKHKEDSVVDSSGDEIIIRKREKSVKYAISDSEDDISVEEDMEESYMVESD